MEHAFAYFRNAGMEVAKIETLDQNPVGQVFYPSMGFEEVARQIHYAKKL
jgi:ribosomal protein S18 acetylase RimI-like enzyme